MPGTAFDLGRYCQLLKDVGYTVGCRWNCSARTLLGKRTPREIAREGLER
ncbi:MAG: hypothetical protein Ct9H300mP1_20740 [Planctomycetaceae bacterium]|nr:MAG: hypothetical protein Ct9H300mP1_20740 [Planctomycetaceae bacterium]